MAELNVWNVLAFVRRWLALLALGLLLGGIGGVVILPHIPPVYEANVLFQVSPGSAGPTVRAEDLYGAEQLARTYAEAMRTRSVLEEASRRAGVQAPFREIQKRVHARAIRDTQLLRLTVENRDPNQAAALANAAAEVFVAKNLETYATRFASSRENLAQFIESLRGEIDARTRRIQQLEMESESPSREAELARLQGEVAQLQATYGGTVRSYEELRVAQARGMDTLTVLQPAVVPEEPVRPSRLLVVALALLGGLAVATALAGVLHYLDDGLRDRQRVANATGLVPLGSIPRSEAPWDGNGLPVRRLAESYRLLLSNFQAMTADSHPKSIVVTSPGVSEGKSTTAAGLAIVLAQSGRRVILADADFYRPTQMRVFGLSNRTGLSTLLLSADRPATAALQPTHVPGLQVLTAGPPPADPSRLLSSKRLEDRLAQLQGLCDLVIFDTPPLMAQPDAALLSSRVDGALLILHAAKSRGRQGARAIEMLDQAGATVVGTVLNAVPREGIEYAEYGYADYASQPEAVPPNQNGAPAVRQGSR